MNLSTLLQTIAREYKFHVYHTLPVENGYLVETNVGSKHISVWRDEELLHWSFFWREELAKKGFRQIDRFIRSRDGSPFVQVNKEYIVVQDRFEDRGVVDDTLAKWEMVGRLTGLIFKACRDLLLNAPSTQKDVPLPKAVNKNEFMTKNQVATLKKEILAQDTMFTYLVHVHWKEIEKRWKHATAIRRISTSKAEIDFMFPAFSLSQWTVLEQGCLGFRCYSQQPSSGLQDIASFLRELYVSGESIEALDQFYSEFEKMYQPTLEEHYTILASFVYPESFLTIINKYLQHGFSAEECVELWMAECEIQEKLDRLHLWHAERIDRLREESVSL